MTGEEAKSYEHEINYIKEHYEPVEDKPGYVWFNRRNHQIIHIETLAKALKDWWEKGKQWRI